LAESSPIEEGMKKAVLSDIHGNSRALEAVIEDMEHRQVDQVINLGDCAYGPFDPTPVLDRVMALVMPTVSGNEDQVLVDLPAAHDLSRTAQFTRGFLTQRHLDWLSSLPLRIESDDLMAFHAQPNSRTGYLLSRISADGSVRRATNAEIVSHLSAVAKPLILCAHDHLPRCVVLEDSRMIINPGSVGCPAFEDDVPMPHRVENGTPHARYALVNVVDGTVRAEFLAVTYDWQAAAKEAQDNGFPDWAQWISTGRV
jgi:predicted phosphodiesterase